MGRTIASITQTWQEEEAALNRFKRALRKDDQVLLDELLVMSRLHLAEASYASNLYPLDMYIIAILLEVYKQLKVIQRELHNADRQEIKEELKEQELFLKLVTNYLGTVDEETQAESSKAEEEHPPLTESKEDNLYTDFEEAP
ncbi:MAG: hypothetical protein KBA03_02335 [Anaerolineaceae bacterium]|nr:hypothetical protein [Anaerolineaceae bacterium]